MTSGKSEESWGLAMVEEREEWLLSFTTTSHKHLFGEGIREQILYTLNEAVPHYAWFDSASYAGLGRATAEAAGAQDIVLKQRKVVVVSTDWVDVP
jgi:hypothetical protein